MTYARHFVIWVRPSRSIMPWKLLCDSRGAAITCLDRQTADDRALQAVEGGSVCAIVGETLLPIESSAMLFARLSTGEERFIAEY